MRELIHKSHKLLLIAAAVMFAVLTACGGGGGGESDPVEPGSLLETNLFSARGQFPNDMVSARGGGLLVIANSGSNTVVGLDPETGTEQWSYSAGEGASPSHLRILPNRDRVAVVNNGSNPQNGNRVDLVALTDGTRRARIDISNDANFQSPGQPALVGDRLFVPNGNISQFDDPETPDTNEAQWDQGTVTVIDLDSESVVNEFNTQFKNPTFAARVPGEDTVAVSTTGPFDFRQPRIETTEDGAVELYDTSGNRQSSLVLGETAPGRIQFTSGETAYVVSGTQPWVFKLNLQTRSVERGPSNPIELYEPRSDSSDAVFDLELMPAANVLVALSFNTDEAYLIDLADDSVGVGDLQSPIGFEQAGQAGLNGPQRAVQVPGNEPAVLVLQTNTSRVDGLRLGGQLR